MEKKYMKIGEASSKLGISRQTLRRYALKNKIKYILTPGGHRLYDINSLNNVANMKYKNICYCRVSSHGQKSDLIRQIKYMQNKYPNYEIIQDVGSGINFKRPG